MKDYHINRPSRSGKRSYGENTHCDRYQAFSGPDDLIDSSDDLETLIGNLQSLIPPVLDAGQIALLEDLCVWQMTDGADRLIAVFLHDGQLIRFDRPHFPVILPFPRNRRTKR